MEEVMTDLPNDFFEELKDFGDTVVSFNNIYNHNKAKKRKVLNEQQKIKKIPQPSPTLSSQEKTRFGKISEHLFIGATKKLQEIKKTQSLLNKLRSIGSKITAPVVDFANKTKESLKKPSNIFKTILWSFVGIFTLFFLFNERFRHGVVNWAINGTLSIFQKTYDILTKDIPKLVRELPELIKGIYENFCILSVDEEYKNKFIESLKKHTLDVLGSIIADVCDALLEKFEPYLEAIELAATVASWTASGFYLGSVIPGIGNAAGAAIGAIIGLAVYLWGRYDRYKKDHERTREEYKKSVNKQRELKNSIEGLNRQIEIEENLNEKRRLVLIRKGLEVEYNNIENAAQQYSRFFIGEWEEYETASTGQTSKLGSPEIADILNAMGYKEGEDFELEYYEDNNGKKVVYIKSINGVKMSLSSISHLSEEASDMIMARVRAAAAQNDTLKNKTNEEIIEILSRVRQKEGTGSLTDEEQQIYRDVTSVIGSISFGRVVDFLQESKNNIDSLSEKIEETKERGEDEKIKIEQQILTPAIKATIENNRRYAELISNPDNKFTFIFKNDIDEEHENKLKTYLNGSVLSDSWLRNIRDVIVNGFVYLLNKISQLVPTSQVIERITLKIKNVSENGMYNNIIFENLVISDSETFEKNKEIADKCLDNTQKQLSESNKELEVVKNRLDAIINNPHRQKQQHNPQKQYSTKESLQEPQKPTQISFERVIERRKTQVIKNNVSANISEWFSEQGSNMSDNGGEDDIQPINEI